MIHFRNWKRDYHIAKKWLFKFQDEYTWVGAGWEEALQPVIQTKAEELSHVGSDKPVLGRVSINEPGVQSVDWLPPGPMLSLKV